MQSKFKVFALTLLLLTVFTSVFFAWQYIGIKTKYLDNTQGVKLSDRIVLLITNIAIINNSPRFKLTIPQKKEVDNLVKGLFNQNQASRHIDRVIIITTDGITNGTEYSLDNKVWAKSESRIENSTLIVYLMLNINLMKEISNTDFNGRMNQILLSEFYNHSDAYLNVPVINRVDLIGKLIYQKKTGAGNKYFFKVDF